MTQPKWRALADRLVKKIEDGTHPPGSTLPKRADLAADLGLSEGTVRAAYRALEAEGYVTARRRVGTVVRDRTPIRVPLARYRNVTRADCSLGPWETATAAQGLNGQMKTVDVGLEAAPDDIAEALGLKAGAPVVRRTRHACIGTEVVQIQRAWYQVDLAVSLGLDKPGKVNGGVYGAMIRGGVPPHRASERVTARMPSADEAGALSLGSSVPLLLVQRVTRDAAGQPLEVLHVLGAADRLELTYDDLPLTGE